MTILFNACEKIKPATRRRFAAGLLAFTPTVRIAHTASDEALYAQLLADEAEARRQALDAYNDHLEERAIRSAEMDRVCSGIPLF